MNIKQAALIKLSQCRLAINHVLRSRIMQKQADMLPDYRWKVEYPNSNYGNEGYVAPEWQWLLRYHDTLHNSPNKFKYRPKNPPKGAPVLYDSVIGNNPNDPRDLAEDLSRSELDPKRITPDNPRYINFLNRMSDDYNQSKPEISQFPGDAPKTWEHTNFLPAWGIDSLMNAPTKAEKARQAEQWIRSQGGEVSRWDD